MSNLPTFTNNRKATLEEQLESAEKLKAQPKLNSALLGPPPEQRSLDDIINTQKEKLQDVGNVLSEPTEYDELDTSGYLPTQQMAGQGAWKAIRSALALQPKEEEHLTIGNDPITGKPIRIDPTGVMGIIKDPKIIGEIVGSLPTNVNKKQLLDALEFKLEDKLPDQYAAYQNLFDSSIRKYMGEKNLYMPEGGGYSSIPAGEFHDDLLNSLYPGIRDLQQDNKIKILMDDPTGVKSGSLGTAWGTVYPTPGIRIPKKISVKKYDDPGTLMHEAQHFQEDITNPFKKSAEAGFKKKYTAKSFIKQIKDINPEINLSEKDVEGMLINDVLIKHGVNPYDFYHQNHFTAPEYKTNYEFEKALELLHEEPRVLESKGVQNNFELLNALVNESNKQRITSGKAKKFLDERGFQSIDQLLKKKP